MKTIGLVLFIASLVFITGCAGDSKSSMSPHHLGSTSPVASSSAVLPQSVKSFTKFPDKMETTGFEDIDKACRLSNAGKYEEAVNLFTELLPKYEKSPVAQAFILVQRGGAYNHLKKYKEAEADFKKSLQLDIPEDCKHIINFQIVDLYDDYLGEDDAVTREEKILEILENIKKAKPNFDINSSVSVKAQLSAHIMYADLMTVRRKFDKALESYNAALSLNPKHYDLYCKRAFCYFLAGDKEKAKRDAQKWFQASDGGKNPSSPDSNSLECKIFAGIILGNYEETLNIINGLIFKDPENSENAGAYYYRAWIFFLKGDKENAKRDLDKILKITRQNNPIRINAKDLADKL